jgi:glycosyltransferase involved in cell wall biosynthesis
MLKSPLRILAITNSYPTPGSPGDTPCILDQIENMRSLGVDVEVFYIDRYKGKASYLRAAWNILRLSLSKNSNYDLLHAYYGHSGLAARMQLRWPVVVTFRGSDLLSKKDSWIGRKVARTVDGLIVMTNEMQIVSRRPDAEVLPFGVNQNIFKPEEKIKARTELDLNKDEEIILFPWDPSRTEKRFDLVSAAIRKLKAEERPIRIQILYNHPPQRVAQYMNACDALVLASDHEGAPMAIREALACKLPIAAVDVGDVASVIENVDNCELCSRSIESLARGLRMILDRNTRISGRVPVEIMDLSTVSERVIGVYRRVLDRSSSTLEGKEGVHEGSDHRIG